LVDGKNYTVEPQNILLLNCKEPHKYYAKGELSFRYFHFDGASSAALYDRLVSLHGNVVKEYNQPIIENTFNIILALAYDGYRNEFKISAHIHLVLCELLTPEVSYENHRSQAVARSISFMENHFLQDLSVKDIAASAYFSEYYFSRLFRKQTGISPHEYLQNLRITFARHLLATIDMPVDLVSEKCGFNNVQHFIRTFKKQIGCTPSGYRKKTTYR
jgi:AraC-like DNA-binding protein